MACQDIHVDIYSDILPNILSDIYSDILLGILSDIYSDFHFEQRKDQSDILKTEKVDRYIRKKGLDWQIGRQIDS